MAGFENDVILGKNLNFDEVAPKPHLGIINAAGKLPIGTGNTFPTPEILGGNIISPNGSITFGYSSPNITAVVAGGTTSVLTLSDDVNTIVTPTAGNIQLVGHVNEQGSTKFSTIVAGTNLLNINPMSSARWIVDSLGFNGTHTTVTSAMASATNGDTIFVLPGSYVEGDIVMKAINLTAFTGDQDRGIVNIDARFLVNSSISCSISNMGIKKTGNNTLVVSGVSSVIMLNNCNITGIDTTPISMTETTATINMNNCISNFSTTGIALYTISAGALSVKRSNFSNTAGSTTASTSAGTVFITDTDSVIVHTNSSTGIFSTKNSKFDTSLLNVIPVTTAGTGASLFLTSEFSGGSASGLSIGAGTSATLTDCTVNSTNTNAITGAGTLIYTPISFTGSSSTVNTSVQTPLAFGPQIFNPLGISFDGTNYLANYVPFTSWTPTLDGATPGTTTYVTQTGRYIRIGNMVHLEGFISISAATGTGNATIAGLPFPINAAVNPIGNSLVNAVGWIWPVGTTMLSLVGQAGTSTCLIAGVGSTVAVSNLQMANAACVVRFSLVYSI